MAQKTAVDLYRSKLLTRALVSNSIKDLFENEEDYFLQAKKIEKEQILNARLSTFDLLRRDDVLKAEQYYNETYNK